MKVGSIHTLLLLLHAKSGQGIPQIGLGKDPNIASLNSSKWNQGLQGPLDAIFCGPWANAARNLLPIPLLPRCASWDQFKDISSVCVSGELCAERNDPNYDTSLSLCQCDDLCYAYGDCCRDSKYFGLSRRDLLKELEYVFDSFTCVNLPIAFSEDLNVKMITTCSEDYRSDMVQLCTGIHQGYNDVYQAIPITFRNSFPQKIPIHLTFRNIYCARCNERHWFNSVLQFPSAGRSMGSDWFWKTTLVCDHHREDHPTSQAERGWDPDKNRWIYTEGNKTHECVLKYTPPEEFMNTLLPHVRCPDIPIVDECPNGTDPHIKTLCKAFTAKLTLKNLTRVYKNKYCLKCNGGTEDDVLCNTPHRITSSHASEDASKITILLKYHNDACSHNEIWEPILKTCVIVARDFIHLQTNHTHLDNCARVKIPDLKFDLSPDNSTIIVNNISFTPDQYRLTENGDIEVCEGDIPQKPQTWWSFLIGISTIVGLSVSIIFLVLHLCAVILVPELHNFSGITVASLCVALLGAYISFIVGMNVKGKSRLWCYNCAVTTYSFFMASFFWMMVLAYDISKVIRASVRKYRVVSAFKFRRFLTYSLITWGSSVISGLLAHFVDNDVRIHDQIRPNFAVYGCWFGSPMSLLIFFVIPLAAIMTINFSFFFYSACLTSENTAGRQKKRRIFVKLTVLLGLTWIVGLLASALDTDFLWIVFSVLNTLQGFFIFVSFTLTPKVLKSLSERFRWISKFTKTTPPQRTPASQLSHFKANRD